MRQARSDLKAAAEAQGLGWSILSKPSGPVSAAFIADLSPITWLMGPNGGGKTTAAFAKGLNVAMHQQPSKIDGVRKVHICVVRTNYRTLWNTTIPSYWQAIPKNWGQGQGDGYGWKGGNGEPAQHRFLMDAGGRGKLDILFSFRGVGDDNIEDFTRGLQVTFWHLEEADLFSDQALSSFVARVGRYQIQELPDPNTALQGVYGTLNAPDEDNWIYQRYLSQLAEEKWYVQPSGFAPDAENISVLGTEYYNRIAAHMDDWAVRKYLKNIPGMSRSGNPVYSEYNAVIHDLPVGVEADPKFAIVVGVDGGSTAAAVFLQQHDYDRVDALDEIVTPNDTTTDGYRFGVNIGEFMIRRYSKHLASGAFTIVADPANFNGGHEAGFTFVQSMIKGFDAATGVRPKVVPAPSNDPDTRRGAVKRLLGDIRDGRPRGMISKRCKNLLRAVASGYKLHAVKRADGSVEWLPLKNQHSHVADAHQYGVLWFAGVAPTAARRSGHAGPGVFRPRQQQHAIHHETL